MNDGEEVLEMTSADNGIISAPLGEGVSWAELVGTVIQKQNNDNKI